jgi:stage III sporulation protein AD
MIITVSVIAMIAAAVALFLKQYKPEYSLIFSAVVCVSVMFFLVTAVGSIKDSLSSFFGTCDIDSDIFITVFKALGICYITDFAADLCKDFGQTSLAAKAELAGKISVVVLSLPIVRLILDTALELMG